MQQTAMRELLARIPGIGNPPTRLKQIESALYVHMRTLAAEDSTSTMVLLDGIYSTHPLSIRALCGAQTDGAMLTITNLKPRTKSQVPGT